MRARRVAVVGAGPSGVYAAEEICRLGHEVDVIDRLPTPYGLLRYGVAPDHLRMKALEVTLRRVLERPTVRFLGDVELGRDVTAGELRSWYDAVVYAVGAPTDRRLGIPGEDLAGSVPATEFVRWYSGHPDARPFELDATAAAVVGMGNVALDVARMLVKGATALGETDIPQTVLDELARSAVAEVHIVGRRGPAHARFTVKELRELGELPGVAVQVDPADLELDEEAQSIAAGDPVVERNLEVFREWAEAAPSESPRRIRFHFWSAPRRILGALDAVSGLEVEETATHEGRTVGTGRLRTIPVGMVLRSIGYRGRPLPGLPFDESSGTIPNLGGRMLRDGEIAPGEYVVGWIKRGPVGVVGTNKLDAKETVALLAQDLSGVLVEGDLPDATEVLLDRGVRPVAWRGWLSIDEAERALGEGEGRPRAKIADWEGLRTAAHGAVVR